MPPYTTTTTLTEIPCKEITEAKPLPKPLTITTKPLQHTPTTFSQKFQTPLIWLNIISICIVHSMAVVGFITFPYLDRKLLVLWGFFTGWASGFGVTGGVHRYWCHRSYKARLPLRIILMVCYSMAGQNRITHWVRDHRVHHKFSETDADPHNANRGFFFAHVGWLMMRKHPEVLSKGRSVDCDDLLQDPVVVFHEKYFVTMKILWCFAIPILVPWYFWGDSLFWSSTVAIARYVCGLNFTWLVNSAAHMFGNKPYDRRIQPVENLAVSIVAMGEGWHNYHHTFPWDYKAAELGNYQFNVTTMLLDFFGKIGWAYDMKHPSRELVGKIIMSHGDGTHPLSGMIPEEAFQK